MQNAIDASKIQEMDKKMQEIIQLNKQLERKEKNRIKELEQMRVKLVELEQANKNKHGISPSLRMIVKAVMHCSRHIVSTTITTCMGFMPLLLGGGGFWPPFGIIIAGGTLLTSVLSFFFVPAVFHWLMIRWPLAANHHHGDEMATVATKTL